MPSPKRYSFEDITDSKGRSKLENLFSKNIRPHLKDEDKTPNIDGQIEILDDNLIPIGKFDVQLKSTNNFKKNPPSFQVEVSFLAYCNQINVPALFIYVSLDENIAYWKYMSTEFLRSLNWEHCKKSKVIKFESCEIISLDKQDYVVEWKNIIVNQKNQQEKFEHLSEILDVLEKKSIPFSPNRIFKLIIIGDGGTGKSSFVKRYITGLYTNNSRITIGSEFYQKDLLLDDKHVRIYIMDFGGEERFRTIIKPYFKDATGGLLLYDIARHLSKHAIESWLSDVWQIAGRIPILLVGAKADIGNERKVSSKIGIEMAKSLKLSGFAEVSAKTGENVEKTFETITHLMCKQALKIESLRKTR